MNRQPAIIQKLCCGPLIGDRAEEEEEARDVDAIATPTDSDEKRKGPPAVSPDIITLLTNTAIDDRVLEPKKKANMFLSLAEGMQTAMGPILTAPSSRVLESQTSLPRATSDLHPQDVHQQLLHNDAFSRQSPAQQPQSYFLTQPALSQQGPLASSSLPMLPHHNQHARGVPPLGSCLYAESLDPLQPRFYRPRVAAVASKNTSAVTYPPFRSTHSMLYPAVPTPLVSVVTPPPNRAASWTQLHIPTHLQPSSLEFLPPIIFRPPAANENYNNERTSGNAPPIPLSGPPADGGPPIGFIQFTDEDVNMVDDFLSVVACFESDDEDSDDGYGSDDRTARCSASPSFFSDDGDLSCESKVVVTFE